MEDRPTVFDAMQAFGDIAQAVTFTPYEVALFYGLLHRWNLAHRDSVIEEWADTTCRVTGLEPKKQLPRARNGLVQKGVIFFEKKGNRGVPRYSFNAILKQETPFLLPYKEPKRRSKENLNGEVNREVNVSSYKEKEEGEVKEYLFFDSLNEVQKKLHELFNKRKQTPWSDSEKRAWKKCSKLIEEDDIELVLRFHAEPFTDSYDPRKRSLTSLLNKWNEEVDKARNHFEKKSPQQSHHSPEITNLANCPPEIWRPIAQKVYGREFPDVESWQELPREKQGEFQSQLKTKLREGGAK